MSIWSRISDALAALAAGEPLSEVFARLRTPPERSVAFAIAVIALGAKMAKADGRVTRDEVTAFREVFHIPLAEERAAARVFDLARQDVAGFEEYARRIAAMFVGQPDMLRDLLAGLFHIAMADGEYHPKENAFLERVAEIFGVTKRGFRTLRARHVPETAPDPYEVLGVTTDAPLAEIRATWREIVRQSHPDLLAARGLPAEAVKLAERRLIAANAAWEEISRDREAGLREQA